MPRIGAWYPRVSDEVNPGAPDFVVPVDNEDPYCDITYAESPDHLRYSDAPGTRPARRGYIAYYFAPQIWQADSFTSGKTQFSSPTATTWLHGMHPDSPQKANLANPTPTSYGTLVDVTAGALGIDPWSGW